MPTVLVIDENRATLDSIGRALRGAGFSVALASTGQEGLRLAGQRAFDLVVADLRLPDVADIEVLKQLRQTLADVPVIVTGLASTASAIEAGKLGAVDYFEKPFLDGPADPAGAHLRTIDLRPPTPAVAHDAMRVSPQVIRTMHVIENRYVETSAARQHRRARSRRLDRAFVPRAQAPHGIDVRDAARRTRVRAACRLLQTTTLSMKEIASRAGFSSASRFDRDFKTVCGVSPSAYRAGLWRQTRRRS